MRGISYTGDPTGLPDHLQAIDRIVTFLDAFSELGIAVNVFPYTVDELDNPVAEIAMRTGKVLFER